MFVNEKKLSKLHAIQKNKLKKPHDSFVSRNNQTFK